MLRSIKYQLAGIWTSTGPRRIGHMYAQSRFAKNSNCTRTSRTCLLLKSDNTYSAVVSLLFRI